MKQLFSNNVDRTLAAAISDADTSVELDNATGLSTPAAGEFELLTLQTEAGVIEVVRMTARSGNVLTVTRGQEGTTAVAWGAGSRIYAGITASTLSSKLANEADGDNAFSVGDNTIAGNNWSLCFGRNAESLASEAGAIGSGAKASGQWSLAVGNAAYAHNESSISVGVGAQSYAHGGFSGPGTHGNIIVGEYAWTSTDGSILIGHNGRCNRQYNVAIGQDVEAQPMYSVVIGAFAETLGYEEANQSQDSMNKVCIGYSASSRLGSFGAVNIGASSVIGQAAPGAIAIGFEAQVADNALLGIALGSITTETPRTLHAGALPAVPRKQGTLTTSDAAWAMVSPPAVIMSDVVDLTAVADVTAPIWDGVRFFPDEVGLIITAADGVTGQPTIRFGITGTLDKLLAATATTGLDAAHKRERFQTLASSDGESSLTAGVTVGATATTLTGRFYWKGFAVVNSV